MKNRPMYTTRLQAGLGLIEETRTLLQLWRPGMNAPALHQRALAAGCFPNISARRALNIVLECFAPRLLGPGGRPAAVLKKLESSLSPAEFAQLLLLFTARANLIFSDFLKEVYWPRVFDQRDVIRNEEARAFVSRAVQRGKTTRPWSESTIRRVASYLTGCCADFGLLEPGRKQVRGIRQFRLEPAVAAHLAHDLHFSGLGDNSAAAHPDWGLYGLDKEGVRDVLKRLALNG
ncbi:MAG: DUF1819 family protein, partial [Desulfobacterales bacterium]|nr:DUF1819 family protein [Desulfobacterales bacterium]